MPQYLNEVKFDSERDRRRDRAHRADRDPFLLRRTAGPHEVQYGLGARGGPIGGADLEHPNPAVHLVVGRLVEVDRRPSRGLSSGFLDHLAAELVVPPEQHRYCEPVPKIVGGSRLRALDSEANRFGPRNVHTIANLEPFHEVRVSRFHQTARVGRTRWYL